VVSIKIASPAGAWGGGDDRNAPNCLWLIESRVRSDGTPAHPRGFLTLDGSSDAGLSEVREDSLLWVAISPRYSAIRQSAAWEFAGYLRRFAIQLFLAIVGGIGIAAVVMGHNGVGAALIFAGVGSMAAAAVVLLLSSPDKARAALTQGTFPLIAIVLLMLGPTSS
jgi:hypothetical protein